MDPFFAGIALASAALHAGWNSFVKAAADRLVVIAMAALGLALAGAAMVPIYGVPARASWGCIALTTVAYYAYLWLLHRTYLHGDVSHAYPLSRGGAPLVVAIGAAFFGDERLTPLAALGVLLACFGIMSLAFFGRPAAQPRLSAVYPLSFATSLVIGTMMVSNGIGARASGSPMAFMAWIFLLQAPVVGFALVQRRGQLPRALRAEPIKALGTGISAALAYGLSIYASAYAPMAGVAALRETSVIMAALLGIVFLGERPWLPRLAAAGLIAIGSVLVATHGVRGVDAGSSHRGNSRHEKALPQLSFALCAPRADRAHGEGAGP